MVDADHDDRTLCELYLSSIKEGQKSKTYSVVVATAMHLRKNKEGTKQALKKLSVKPRQVINFSNELSKFKVGSKKALTLMDCWSRLKEHLNSQI